VGRAELEASCVRRAGATTEWLVMRDPNGGALLRRMLERCLYVPTRNPKSKSKVGGSKLSTIGRNRISVETLETALRKVFQRNSELYASLAEHLEEHDPAKLAAKFQPMYDQFIANIEEHVTFRHED
jgi:hypothetical protein